MIEVHRTSPPRIRVSVFCDVCEAVQWNPELLTTALSDFTFERSICVRLNEYGSTSHGRELSPSVKLSNKEKDMKEEKPRCETCTYDSRCDPVTPESRCLYCGNYALPKTTPKSAPQQK